nr:hypothetical protein CFP56_53321 [Quercus suber]
MLARRSVPAQPACVAHRPWSNPRGPTVQIAVADGEVSGSRVLASLVAGRDAEFIVLVVVMCAGWLENVTRVSGVVMGWSGGDVSMDAGMHPSWLARVGKGHLTPLQREIEIVSVTKLPPCED